MNSGFVSVYIQAISRTNHPIYAMMPQSLAGQWRPVSSEMARLEPLKPEAWWIK
jgi:hypothetical protein